MFSTQVFYASRTGFHAFVGLSITLHADFVVLSYMHVMRKEHEGLSKGLWLQMPNQKWWAVWNAKPKVFDGLEWPWNKPYTVSFFYFVFLFSLVCVCVGGGNSFRVQVTVLLVSEQFTV